MGDIGSVNTQVVIVLFVLLLLSVGYAVHTRRQLGRVARRADRVVAELNTQLGNNHALLRAAVDGIHVINLKGDVVLANESFARMLGYEQHEVMKLNVLQWDMRFEQDDLIANIPMLRGIESTFETQHKRKNGQVIDVEITSVGVVIDDVPLLFCSARDITARKYVEQKLLQAASVFHHSHESVMIIESDGTLVDVNQAFTRVTGYSREEALGQRAPLINAECNDGEVCQSIKTALEQSGYWTGETWNLRKNGELYVTRLTVSRVPDISGRVNGLVGVFTDITPLKDHQKQLETIAHYDPLTRLPNRVLLGERLKHGLLQAVRRDNLVAVVYLDLDGFKTVNDTGGHDAGDQLLVELAGRMKHALRDGDTLARIGGDEFVAILVDLESVEACETVLQRLLQAAAEPVQLGAQRYHVSASIGVALYPHNGTDADLLLRCADHAMYQAKKAGKNRFQFFSQREP
jgi:diguanylate cyclase (GGDEF)-like protein/PAS domain S-box-containing protein